jgi:hypothetical protein
LNSLSSFQNSGTLDSGSYSYTTLRNDNTEITTIAGKLENYADGIGVEAEFSYLNKIVRVGTNIYVIDGLRIRVLNPATGEVSTLQTSGESFDWIEGLTTDGTDIYFTSYVSGANSSGYKLFKLSLADGVVSMLDLVDDKGDTYSISNSIIELAPDGTTLFVAVSTSPKTFLRISLQTGLVTPYTTGGVTLPWFYGMEKIGDSLFASASNSIYEIELSGTGATASTVCKEMRKNVLGLVDTATKRVVPSGANSIILLLIL